MSTYKSTMKRVIATTLLLVSGLVLAAPDLKIVGPDNNAVITGNQGSIVIASIWYTPPASNAPTAIQFTVSYSGQHLQLGKAVDGATLAGTHVLFANKRNAQDKVDIVISPKENNVPVTAGEIAQIPFYLNGSISCPDISVSLGIESVIMSNETNIAPGVLTNSVVKALCLDTDGDGLADYQDKFPRNSAWKFDTDNDGVADAIDPDIDGDGIPNELDPNNSNSNPNADSDGDGLSDYDEYVRGTRGDSSDTDGDGLPDGWEVQYGLNPLDNGSTDPNQGANGDPDGEQLLNIGEYQHKTDPKNADTDSDNMNDKMEIDQGRSPIVNEPAIMTIIDQLLLSN